MSKKVQTDENHGRFLTLSKHSCPLAFPSTFISNTVAFGNTTRHHMVLLCVLSSFHQKMWRNLRIKCLYTSHLSSTFSICEKFVRMTGHQAVNTHVTSSQSENGKSAWWPIKSQKSKVGVAPGSRTILFTTLEHVMHAIWQVFVVLTFFGPSYLSNHSCIKWIKLQLQRRWHHLII